MNWKIIFKALKVLCSIVIDYLRKALGAQLKEAFQLALEAFKTTLWEHVKAEATQAAKEAIRTIKAFYVNPDVQNRKKAIVDDVVKQIKLPLVVKPFRGLIKKMLNDKIDELVESLTNKGLNALD